MAYQVLSRRLRPRRFEDVIGQAHITRSLQNAILRNKVGHAYLLTGTRGIGKTSVARIFAKALRCEKPFADANPCGECSSCCEVDGNSSMNVFEIDGASNNSVDDVRDIVENVQYLPTSGQYKIYIIDEVHMLSASAFNALLKTLEEPPEHVIFILATTEPGKMLNTVLSRCQRFDFRDVLLEDLINYIDSVSQKENIQFENKRLIKLLCLQGRGSVRDTLSLLDQVLSYSASSKITEETLSYALGLARSSHIKGIISSVVKGDEEELSRVFKKLLSENVKVESILSAILDSMFSVIENIDQEEILVEEEIIERNLLKDISIAEAFWLYETMAKESIWVVESLLPHKSAEILLKKLALRRTFFSKDKDVDSKKKKHSNQSKEKVTPEKPKKTWDNFLVFLNEKSPASASNLEQGNIIAPLMANSEGVSIELGFNEASKVFLDYLQEKDVYSKLIGNVSEFFECSGDKVRLSLVYVDREKEKNSNFISKAEIKKKEEEEIYKKKEDGIRNSSIVRKAEEIFAAKVDKVIVK